MPTYYTITKTAEIDIDEAVVTETETNANDNSITKTANIDIDEAVVTETETNANDNSITKTAEIPLFNDPNYAYNVYIVRPGGKYNSRATQNVLIGSQWHTMNLPLYVWRGKSFVWVFRLDSSTDFATPVTGKTGITVMYSKDGGAFITISDTITEIGDGKYAITIPEDATNVVDTTLALQASASGCWTSDEIFYFYKGQARQYTKSGVGIPSISQPITSEAVQVVP